MSELGGSAAGPGWAGAPTFAWPSCNAASRELRPTTKARSENRASRHGVGPAPAEHEIHAPWDNEKTSGDGLLEHPAQCDLGEAALGLRVATADIAVNARKPDLLEVARAAVR